MGLRHLAIPLTVLFIASFVFNSNALAEDKIDEASDLVSYHKQIRPIFQAHCNGCHQPAKPSGGFVMTDFNRLFAGGDSEEKAIVAGHPEKSDLIDEITPENGEAEMPKDAKPLTDEQIVLITKWIQQGAKDDSPENTRQKYDQENPPQYTRQPVVTSIDFSPDGKLFAIAGFHEILLYQIENMVQPKLAGRLVGLSERIESVKFSPDGKRIAATGGSPGRMGEVQVWDVAKQELLLSKSVTYDTIYGGSWSPDGKLIAFGCADNTVRAIDSATGEQVLFQGAHNDWVRDTVFSVDGSHMVSVGRDMTAKLIEVATERFVDNITSITPGALSGGVNAVARHPERDEIVIGSADGVPKVYRMHRLTPRKIGDDANLIRRFPALKGRIFGVAMSPDGKTFAAVSSLNGNGQLGIYEYPKDTSLPDNLKKILSQTGSTKRAEVIAYVTKDVKVLHTIDVQNVSLFSATYSPDSKTVAVSGADGNIRLIDVSTGKALHLFTAAPKISAQQSNSGQLVDSSEKNSSNDVKPTSIPAGANVTSLKVLPERIAINGPFEYTQLLVTAELSNGQVIDVTRNVTANVKSEFVSISPTGLIRGIKDGNARFEIEFQNQKTSVETTVAGINQKLDIDFIRDVNPVLSRMGCNLGTCHGAAKGKNGFKLSLRGYDAIFDIRSLTDDLASRRVNIASPDQSLMLLKATGSVAHVGSQLTQIHEPYYKIVRQWISEGATLNLNAPRVVNIDVFPKKPIIQKLGSQQQMRVVATYSDGTTRDVTREAFIESSNTEVATASKTGLLTAIRRGEAAVLARYEGAYAATTLTAMGERDEFVWEEPPKFNKIDEFTAIKWKRMKIKPSGLCTDEEFLRRVYLDLTGLPPKADDVKKFLADKRPSREKREAVIDQLVASEDYVEYWTNKWADLLQVNRKFLGAEGAASFRKWIRNEVATNTPYDEFVRKIVTASGSNLENPAASYFKILRTPEDTMENTTHLFLAVRFNCNKCHDHPFERWTQDQYYETAAFFAQTALKNDPKSGNRRIGGTAVEGAKAFYEIVYDKKDGEVTHERTGAITPPEFPYESQFSVSDEATRRQRLAAWMTSPDNQYFARSYVNRLWGYLLGTGIIEPIDDIRAGNPPSNPELLDYLTEEFINSKFDVRHVVKLIAKSRTYQLSLATNEWNEDDTLNYSHAKARRLPAEVLLDSIYRVTGTTPKIPGVPAGTRAAALPDSGVKLSDGFLNTFGRPARESSCECERSNDLQLGPVMALISGPTVAAAIVDGNNELNQLAAKTDDEKTLINEIFLRVLNRSATEEEIAATIETMNTIDADHQKLITARDKRQAYVDKIRPQLEKERQDAIAAAKADLDAYQEKIAPEVDRLNKERDARIAKAQADLKAYDDKIAELLANWEKKQKQTIEWIPLAASSLKASNGAELTRLEDRSIRAEGKADKGNYVITVKTNLKNINGIRLEALPIEGIPGGGPGLPANGNFVVTEFEVTTAPQSDPKKMTPVKLTNPKANFAQANFDINQTLDGNKTDQKGWAVSPAGGVVHWAVFETDKPIANQDGVILRFVIHQYHSAQDHRLARFRISATTDARPIPLGLPEDLDALVSIPVKERTEKQSLYLTNYFRKTDPGLVKLNASLATARTPVPVDPGVTKRQEKLNYVSQPLPEDSRLVQLNADVKQSELQLQDKRKTAAQDLAWVLINSPAFLFNH